MRFLLLTALFICPVLTLFLIPFPVSADYIFGTDLRVNEDPPGSSSHWTVSAGMHSIAARGDTVYVVWEDRSEGWGGVYFARSDDGGISFGPSVRVDDLPMGRAPCLAAGADGTLYVAWEDRRHDQGHDIYFDKSTDGGETWGSDVRVDGVVTNKPNGLQIEPSVAVDNLTGNVYVAWQGDDWPPPSCETVLVARSTDGGQSFERSYTVEPSGMVAHFPSLAVGPDGRIYLAYADHYGAGYDLVVIMSEDAGCSFHPPVLVGYGIRPSIFVSPSGHIHVALVTGAHPVYERLEASRSLDGGLTFEPTVILEEEGAAKPSLAAGAGGLVCVAYSHASSAGVCVSYSLDFGASFFSGVPVPDPGASATYPTIAVDEIGRAFVAWTDFRHHPDFGDVYFDVGSPAAAVAPNATPGSSEAQNGTRRLWASPTPFAGESTLRFRPPPGAPGAQASMNIFDVRGELVRRIHPFPDGPHLSAVWDGTDDRGQSLPSGIYFARLRAGEGEWTTRLVLLR